MNETTLRKLIQIEASRRGYRLLRNQVGKYRLPDGRVLSSGIPGTSDLIGWRTVIVTQEMVGEKIAVFAALEVKTFKGRPDQEGKQENFLKVVRLAGGIGKFVRSVEDIP